MVFCFNGSAYSSELKKALELPLPQAIKNRATLVKLATVKMDQPREFKPLQAGEALYENGTYVWKTVPAEFAGFKFAKTADKHEGTTSFQVQTAGVVYVAFTSRWKLKDSEEAREGFVSRREMIRDGWKPLVKGGELVSDEVNYVWNVFVRECKAGEKFTLRTEKYCPPIVLIR